ncbi:hypothetical protein ANOM_007288 [Aspergillus nomiae NRRL 13137]|uniref:GIY-YIG domain-containing protein n=1 Tax=Aspergillus nomiae NRRL (strain ATCC 15546 / NRRL 13137 / CBS 260.88 / M93) TaxID=1509407 RepID=A0A0L1J3N1_ASPN3|nr:uncharacterized protein ANOM_007288 [Aspergillus nomiae NRRL 13137]KNG86359.1 hypothetical protein ANOM_007288 [Aspergillus nomiae NRRL 13137]
MMSVYVDSVRDVEILAIQNITAEQGNVADYTRERRAKSPSSTPEGLLQPSTNTSNESDISQSIANAEPPKENQLNETPGGGGPATTRNNFTAGVVGEPLQLQNIGPVDRTLILKQLISKTAEKYEGSLIAIGQNPESLSDCGVYLHILWRKSNPQNFWLYVGQAAELRERIRTHNDIYRRKRNPSLHYHVWDSAEDIESVFVTLGFSEKPTSVKTQLLLNLLEMWMALVFQTLTSVHLDQYLPESVNKLWSGNHLNVALPLWQGFTEEDQAVGLAVGGRMSFQQHLFSDDPTIRQWAENARDAFNDIRNSPDALLRQYYQNLLSRCRARGQEASQRRKSMNIMKYLEPTKTTVKTSHEGELCEVLCGSFRFTISQLLGLHLKAGDQVFLQFHLAGSRHPNAYAQLAETRDPASRLAVSISGHDAQGSFHTWLQTQGIRNVYKMNSLVDVLEGFSFEESQKFERRWHSVRLVAGDGSSRKNVYT